MQTCPTVQVLSKSSMLDLQIAGIENFDTRFCMFGEEHYLGIPRPFEETVDICK